MTPHRDSLIACRASLDTDFQCWAHLHHCHDLHPPTPLPTCLRVGSPFHLGQDLLGLMRQWAGPAQGEGKGSWSLAKSQPSTPYTCLLPSSVEVTE
jgi:hypothetical protein